MGLVLDSAAAVCQLARHVSINDDAILTAVNQLKASDINDITSPKAFDEELHFQDGGPLTAQYLLVVDALNFCFWPEPDLEYEHMSKGVKAAVLRDPSSISAERLSQVTSADVREFFGWHRDVPLQEERARLLREVGHGLLQHFEGQAAKLVEAAGHSAVRLVELVTMHFPGFRDHAVYEGRQVFLYKRAQIFIGDLFGAFQGKGLGHFTDLDQITMFADYRVPVVLHTMGILQYSEALTNKIQQKQCLDPGSVEEVEIRAATIVAVERLRQHLAHRWGPASPPGVQARPDGSDGQAASPSFNPAQPAKAQASGPGPLGPEQGVLDRGLPCAVQLDWWLWHIGERNRKQHPPHHRTLTVFY